jgi:manganese oxidase
LHPGRSSSDKKFKDGDKVHKNIQQKRRNELFKRKKFLVLFSTVLTLSVISGLLVGSSVASAQTTSSSSLSNLSPVTYNLYATDGWWMMADGTPIYAYGYVGGQNGKDIYPVVWDGANFVNEKVTVQAPAPGPSNPWEDNLRGKAQFPAPLITCTVGQQVTITLKNLGTTPTGLESPPNVNAGGSTQTATAPNDPHTIHLHALDVDVANDGVPETSVAAIPSNGGDPGAGNVVVYNFKATRAGTYFYHCHQEADIHVTMGMYGMLIVYNPTDAGRTTGPGSPGTLYGFHYDRDVLMLLSDTDVRQHLSEAILTDRVATGNGDILLSTGIVPGSETDETPNGVYNPVNYTPQYWFINMLSFPDTVHAGGSGIAYNVWLKAHPGYEPMITGSVSKKDKVLVRVVNMGFETQPMHMHGFHAKVIGSDQRPWTWANNPLIPTGLGLEKNTLNVGSGEEYDLLFDFSTQAVTSTYNPGTQTRYDSTSNLPLSNTATTPTPNPTIVGGGGNPYIAGPKVKGVGDDFPTDLAVPAGTDPTKLIGLGQDAVPAPTSQIFVFHNHDDYKATNNGIYPGGMFTVIVPLP